jgi:hypothetical protein
MNNMVNLSQEIDFYACSIGWKAGVWFPAGSRFFSSHCLHWLWSAPNLLSSEYRGRFPLGLKQPGREADYLSPSSAEVKNGGAITPLPHTSSCHCLIN